MYKNNSTVSNGTKNVANGTNYTITSLFYNVKIDDVIELSVWCSNNTNVTIIKYLSHVTITRLLPTTKPCIDVSITTSSFSYSDDAKLTSNSQIYIGNSVVYNFNTGTITFSGLSFISQNGYNLFRNGFGDTSNKDGVAEYTFAGYVSTAYSTYISSVSFREVRRGV
jgi:hypothetical protein